MKPSLAQTGSFACLFGCILLARPLRLGSHRVGSPGSVVSLIRCMDLGQYGAWTLINTMHGPWSIRCMDPDQYDAWTWSIRCMDPDQYDAWTGIQSHQRRRYLLPAFHTCSCRTLSLQNERIGLHGWKHRLAAADLHFRTTTLSKHIKGSKERYLLEQNHNLQIFWVIPFIKLQICSKRCCLIKGITPENLQITFFV